MYQRILVPVNGSTTAAAGLDQAIVLAGFMGATLCLVHVLDAVNYCNGFETGAIYCGEVVPHMKRTGALILDESRQRAERAGLKAETALFETSGGAIADLVLEHSKRWGADLIVMGTRGRHGADRLFMVSDAEQVMRGATVPVLLVRPSPPAERDARRGADARASRTSASAHG